VEVKIFFGLIALLIISTGTVFAQDPLISVQTNDNNYNQGDIIVISGEVSTPLPGIEVVIQLFTEGTMVEIAQLTVAKDGTFSHTIIADGPLWQKSGTYLLRVSYDIGGGITTELEFNFSPKSESVETTTIFEVKDTTGGTFDVQYTIKGGTIKDMIVDPNSFSLIVQIESTDDGTISLDLLRDKIGAEKQDGKDDAFIILIDGIEVAYQESVVHSDSRVITINFIEGDSDIEIIGTYIIPEFGTIAMMILTVGIISVILVSRNKFQIKI